MTAAVATRPARGLDGAALLVPALQAEPLPIRAIRPAPCTLACPAGVNVKAYVSLIAEGRFADALEVVRQRCPLPGICGRVCHHPCELACKRGRADEPVAIRALKRFVADLERDRPRPKPRPVERRGHHVAVIGSGPAGLAAAYDLRLAGYDVTVYEAEDEPGGMLRYGITAYRLPRDILDAEIEVLVRAGVRIRTGSPLGQELALETLRAGAAQAVLLAVGAQRGRRLGIPGEARASGVEDALSFLRRVNDGDHSPLSGPVAVVGGGSTAVEAARTALRLGANPVDILYRRSREELRAGTDEVEAAEAEGIRFRFLAAPKRLLLRGRRLEGLECCDVGLGRLDEEGRRRPVVIPGTEFRVPAARILTAVGQEADLGFLTEEERLPLVDHGLLRTDEATAMTPLPGVFAAGDAVLGPATVIEAIASGHAAAESIRHYLEEGRPGIWEQRPERRAAPEYELPELPPIEAARERTAHSRPATGREFSEVERALTRESAIAEARRCLRCGPCGECHACAPSCSRRHVMLRLPLEARSDGPTTALVRAPGSLALALPQAQPTPGWLLSRATPGSLLEIDRTEGRSVELLPVRARVVEARCRACGRCVDVCPFGAAELIDDSSPHARIEAALCRGCNLCTAVCPTNAAQASALSPEWWGSRLDEVLRDRPSALPGAAVVLACQRRAGALEGALAGSREVEVIRFRCVGQLDAGMLLELLCLGNGPVLVAGCRSERCRFGEGARLAAAEVERARSLVRLTGGDPERIATDWSPNRAHDPLRSIQRPAADASATAAGGLP